MDWSLIWFKEGRVWRSGDVGLAGFRRMEVEWVMEMEILCFYGEDGIDIAYGSISTSFSKV